MSFRAICRGIDHGCTGVGRCGCGRIRRRERELPRVSTGRRERDGVGHASGADTSESRVPTVRFLGGGFDGLVEVVGVGLDRDVLGVGVDLLGVELVLLRRPGLGRCGGLLLGELRRGHRLELLVGGQLAALGDDEGLHLDADVLEDVDRHVVAADALDVLQVDLAPVDADLARAPDLVGDVRRRDRAEERAGRAGLHLEAEHRLAQRLRDRLRLLGVRRLVTRPLRVALAQLGDARVASPPRRACAGAGSCARSRARRRRRRRAARPCRRPSRRMTSISDPYPGRRDRGDRRCAPDRPAPSATYGSSAISRARFTACATCTWWRRQAPVMRRLRILPFSEM